MSIQIKTIDSDGVVVNSEPLYEQSGRELFRQYDVVIRNNDWQEFKALHPIDFSIHAKTNFNFTSVNELDL